MVDLVRANDYFKNRLNSDVWNGLTDDKKQAALNTAEIMLQNSFTFREGFEITDSWFYGVCEQAIHLLQFDTERLKLQQEGVRQYAVGDNSFTMNNSIISPITKGFLKSIIYKQVGKVVL